MAHLKAIEFFKFLFRQLFYTRTLTLLALYAGLFVLSLFLAYQLRFDFFLEERHWEQLYRILPWIVALKLLLMFFFGQFGILLSYFRIPDVYRIMMAMGAAAFVLAFAWYLFQDQHNSVFGAAGPLPPRSVIMGDFVFSIVFVVGFRTLLRILRERYLSESAQVTEVLKRVAIVGAGETGANAASEMLARRGLGLRPVVYLDDDRNKWRVQMHGIPVVDSPDHLEFVKSKYGIEGIIIADPNLPAKRLRDLSKEATRLGLTAEILPSFSELTSGQVRASRVRPVEVEDLLGREPVALDSINIRKLIEGKVAVVTGAGGSIGTELCRQVALNNPKRLILIEQSEVQLFQVETLLRELGFSGILLPLIGDVLDTARMESIFERHRPHLVFHAAAHKHVPIMERQPGEALKNNTLGTAGLARIAAAAGVERFLFISTDKAINPTNIMGASKRLAEIFLQALFASNGSNTRFMAVRFGNVLGSSGSVIPVFRKQINAGGPVTVTHPEVTRYFMTIPEAVGLVLQCATQAEGGEIFVLDMGTPVRILDLARQMIELSGFRPGEDIEIQFIGLRAGEKLYEELKHRDESHAETAHERIFRFVGTSYDLADVEAFLQSIQPELDSGDANSLKTKVRHFVPEYTPHLD